jgi:hypothetical protein
MVQRFYLVSGHVQKWSEGDWVSYEDYEKLTKSVRACVAAIREGSLTVEHVQGYLEGVMAVLDD